MTKKCECGKDMEDWMKVCKECFGKSLDKPESKDRQKAIETQSIIRSAAIILQGTNPTPETFEIWFTLMKGKL